MSTYIVAKVESGDETYLGEIDWSLNLALATKYTNYRLAENKLLSTRSQRGGPSITYILATLSDDNTTIIERRYYTSFVNHNNYYNSATYE